MEKIRQLRKRQNSCENGTPKQSRRRIKSTKSERISNRNKRKGYSEMFAESIISNDWEVEGCKIHNLQSELSKETCKFKQNCVVKIETLTSSQLDLVKTVNSPLLHIRNEISNRKRKHSIGEQETCNVSDVEDKKKSTNFRQTLESNDINRSDNNYVPSNEIVGENVEKNQEKNGTTDEEQDELNITSNLSDENSDEVEKTHQVSKENAQNDESNILQNQNPRYHHNIYKPASSIDKEITTEKLNKTLDNDTEKLQNIDKQILNNSVFDSPRRERKKWSINRNTIFDFRTFNSDFRKKANDNVEESTVEKSNEKTDDNNTNPISNVPRTYDKLDLNVGDDNVEEGEVEKNSTFDKSQLEKSVRKMDENQNRRTYDKIDLNNIDNSEDGEVKKDKAFDNSQLEKSVQKTGDNGTHLNSNVRRTYDKLNLNLADDNMEKDEAEKNGMFDKSQLEKSVQTIEEINTNRRTYDKFDNTLKSISTIENDNDENKLPANLDGQSSYNNSDLYIQGNKVDDIQNRSTFELDSLSQFNTTNISTKNFSNITLRRHQRNDSSYDITNISPPPVICNELDEQNSFKLTDISNILAEKTVPKRQSISKRLSKSMKPIKSTKLSDISKVSKSARLSSVSASKTPRISGSKSVQLFNYLNQENDDTPLQILSSEAGTDDTDTLESPRSSSTPKILKKHVINTLLKSTLKKQETRNVTFSESANDSHINNSIGNTSKISIKKPVSRVKVPNFAMIHKKHFDKMENISDYKERKFERAMLLLSGNKPIPKKNISNTSNITSSTTNHTPQKAKCNKELSKLFVSTNNMPTTIKPDKDVSNLKLNMPSRKNTISKSLVEGNNQISEQNVMHNAGILRKETPPKNKKVVMNLSPSKCFSATKAKFVITKTPYKSTEVIEGSKTMSRTNTPFKPKQLLNFKDSFEKLSTNKPPVNKADKPVITNNNSVPQFSPKPQKLVSKIKPLNSAENSTGNFYLKAPLKKQFSTNKTAECVSMVEKVGYTRFGFRVPMKPNKQEAAKMVMSKGKLPQQSNREKKRTVIKGVRSNRRFDLLMKMREANK